MPVLNVPFRLIFAYNPQRGGVLRQQAAAAEGVPVPVRGRDDLLNGRPSGVESTASDIERIQCNERFCYCRVVRPVAVRAERLARVRADARRAGAAGTGTRAAEAGRAARAAQAPRARPAPAAPPAQPPAPFPAGAKIAFVNLQAMSQASADGKAAATRVNALTQKKQTESADKAKALQGNQQKLQTSGSVMSETARAQLEKEIERQTKDASASSRTRRRRSTSCSRKLQHEFQRSCCRSSRQLSDEKGLHLLFNAAESGIIWADAGPRPDRRSDQEAGRDRASPRQRRRSRSRRSTDANGRWQIRRLTQQSANLAISRSRPVSNIPMLLDRLCYRYPSCWSTRSPSTKPGGGWSRSRTSPSTRSSSRDTFPARR